MSLDVYDDGDACMNTMRMKVQYTLFQRATAKHYGEGDKYENCLQIMRKKD